MRLYVNIDHIATLREARRTDEPDVVQAAAAAERGGADGITVHLREDRRHIQDADVRALRRTVRTVLNLELGAHDEIVRIARRVRPFQATLVPERRQEITTEGGLALPRGDRRVAGAVRRLTDAGIRVSLFLDPDLRVIERAAELGAPAVELHTGRYAHTWHKSAAALAQLRRAATHARHCGLAVHAGHGLTYRNVQPVAAIPELEELNIGHTIVSNAVFWGLEEAVRRMRHLVDQARDPSAAPLSGSAHSSSLQAP
jgi:pyridoxine 5-phosphate synthase